MREWSYSFTLGRQMKGTVALVQWPSVLKLALSPFTIGSDHNVNCFMDSFFWNPSDNQQATLKQKSKMDVQNSSIKKLTVKVNNCLKRRQEDASKTRKWSVCSISLEDYFTSKRFA